MGDLTHRGTKEGSGSGWVFPEIISTVKLALSSSLFMPHHDTSGSISVSSADDDGGVPCKLQDLDSLVFRDNNSQRQTAVCLSGSL